MSFAFEFSLSGCCVCDKKKIRIMKKLIISFLVMVALTMAIHLLRNCPLWCIRLAAIAFICSWGYCIAIVVKSAKTL